MWLMLLISENDLKYIALSNINIDIKLNAR